MASMEKLRKRTRNNWKREQKAKYRFLMSCAKRDIKNATSKYCLLKQPCENHDYFALWLVAKKLAAKGFSCTLKRGTFTFSRIFYYDELSISWE